MEMVEMTGSDADRTIVDEAGEGTWEWCLKTGRIIFDDHWVRLFGYEPGDIDFNIDWLKNQMCPDSRFEFENAYERYVSGKTRYLGLNYRLRNSSGEWRWVRSLGKFTDLDHQDRPSRISGWLQDITERKKLESQLIQAQKMEAIGRLAGGIAHDFNNYLTTIIGYSELSEVRLPGDNKVREYLKEIIKAGRNAAILTGQLLAFSRKQVFQLETIDVNAEIGSMVKMLNRLLDENIQLHAVLKPGVKCIRADRTQIQQVIMNLAINARDAMLQGGKLIIETGNSILDESYAKKHGVRISPGPYVMISISDTGEGMDRETVKKIFEPFFTTKDKGKGTGLGLSTVYGIIKQSNGFIWVYSEPGKGTAFEIYLPAIREDQNGRTEPPEVPVESLQGDEVVLVVEDDSTVRRVISRILRRHGYIVLEAGSGKEAIDICERHEQRVDLILTDVVMPELSGTQVTDQIKSLKPGIKIIFMSGYPDESIVHHGILSSDRFIQKPISTHLLTRKIREVLDTNP